MKILTLKIFFALLALYALLWLPGIFMGDKYLDTALGFLAVFPVLSVYLFHAAGVPGLLVNNGACGWGWCAPTLFGWVFISVLWTLVLLLISLGISQVLHTLQRED